MEASDAHYVVPRQRREARGQHAAEVPDEGVFSRDGRLLHLFVEHIAVRSPRGRPRDIGETILHLAGLRRGVYRDGRNPQRRCRLWMCTRVPVAPRRAQLKSLKHAVLTSDGVGGCKYGALRMQPTNRSSSEMGNIPASVAHSGMPSARGRTRNGGEPVLHLVALLQGLRLRG